jgi:hypothetical protein
MSQAVGRVIFLLAVWLFSLAYYLECIRLPRFSEKITIGITFWLLTLFVGLELFRQIRKVLGGGGPALLPYREILRKGVADRRIHLVAAVILYILFIPAVGFYVTSFLAFCAFSYLLGTRGFMKTVVPGVIILAFIFFIFTSVLKVNLPTGLFF